MFDLKYRINYQKCFCSYRYVFTGRDCYRHASDRSELIPSPPAKLKGDRGSFETLWPVLPRDQQPCTPACFWFFNLYNVSCKGSARDNAHSRTKSGRNPPLLQGTVRYKQPTDSITARISWITAASQTAVTYTYEPQSPKFHLNAQSSKGKLKVTLSLLPKLHLLQISSWDLQQRIWHITIT